MTPVAPIVLTLLSCRQGPQVADSQSACSPSQEIPYDGLDQDCDGDDLTDVDGDQVHHPTDCDDQDPNTYPGAPETPYDGIDQDCNGQDLIDLDDDGFGFEVDCDDEDPSIFPGATEVCDDVDQDCDGEIDNDPIDGAWFPHDSDGDGFAGTEAWSCEGWGLVAVDDCDDSDPLISPAATEACGNHQDDNCDGLVDTMLAGKTHTTVQAAIDAACADGDEVWISEGVYSETVELRRPLKLRGYGNKTILDAQGCTGECTVLSIQPTAANSSVDGLHLTGGTATQGGGVFVEASGVTLSNLLIDSNTADKGGGLASSLAENLEIEDCTFSNNYAGLGSAIYLGIGSSSLSSTEIRNTSFEDNESLYITSGTVYLNHLSDSGYAGLIIDNNTFESNTGGGVMAARGVWTLSNNTFNSNAGAGAVMCGSGGVVLSGNVFTANEAVYYPSQEACER